jgi:class 3 adenylate cyclase
MMEAVHRYEETVNQVMGDGIMALFGAPLAHEDHAMRACYAALRMQQAVKRHGDGMRRRHGLIVQIRVGLNSGDVPVRAIGADLRMDYTAVGQTTHLAARMKPLAAPGAIVLGPATLELVEGYVEVNPLGLRPVKGLAEPVEVYDRPEGVPDDLQGDGIWHSCSSPPGALRRQGHRLHGITRGDDSRAAFEPWRPPAARIRQGGARR